MVTVSLGGTGTINRVINNTGGTANSANNVVNLPNHTLAKARLAKTLDTWMRQTDDPRVDPANDIWSAYEYFGSTTPMPVSAPRANN